MIRHPKIDNPIHSMLLLAFLCSPLILPAHSMAQGDDLEMARSYPPHLVKTEIALEQMSWQMGQLENRLARQKRTIEKHRAKSEHLNMEIQAISKSLPIELRFANDKVRSSLIGDVLRELLAGRLEVATQEETIAQLTQSLSKEKKESSKADEIRKQKSQLRIQATRQKLALTEASLAKAEQLFKKSAISESDVDRERYALEIARMELEHAMLDYEMEESSHDNEVADRLVEARILLQPAKARVAAAEQFLKLFAESHEKMNAIEKLRREVATLEERREHAIRGIWTTENEIAEFQILQHLTKAGAEKAKQREKEDTKE